MRRKWGSCSTKGIITLASDLVDEDRRFQDFVIAHELLHTRVPNHGRLFKALDERPRARLAQAADLAKLVLQPGSARLHLSRERINVVTVCTLVAIRTVGRDMKHHRSR
jgi:hypothetical protein